MASNIQIKGISDGLLITLGEGEWDDIHQSLLEQLDNRSDFLRGARVTLDVGNQVLKAAELGQLRNEISEREISLWAILSDSPTTESTAQTLGLATKLTSPTIQEDAARLETTLHDGEGAILVQRTLRSGYSLTYPGHVVVIGDVNPGAEVIASGNIIVWGRLRGLAHAGAEGDTEAVVCALDLSPTSLLISGKIAELPNKRPDVPPTHARLLDERVITEPWKSIKGK